MMNEAAIRISLSTVQLATSAPFENTAPRPSIAWRFHVLTWFG
jgi:hypothetical protein